METRERASLGNRRSQGLSAEPVWRYRRSAVTTPTARDDSVSMMQTHRRPSLVPVTRPLQYAQQRANWPVLHADCNSSTPCRQMNSGLRNPFFAKLAVARPVKRPPPVVGFFAPLSDSFHTSEGKCLSGWSRYRFASGIRKFDIPRLRVGPVGMFRAKTSDGPEGPCSGVWFSI